MGILDILGLRVPDSISDKGFEKGLKKFEKYYPGDQILDRQLNFALKHHSVKSAFWWYEHLLVKPDLGLDEDILVLHRKFMTSLVNCYSEKKRVSKFMQVKFLELVLPNNFDYSEMCIKQITSKTDCINSMMATYEMQKKHSPYSSPFITHEYWLIFYHDWFFYNGEIVKDENGITPYGNWLKQFMQKYGNELRAKF